MTQNTQNNNTAALRHCESGTTETIQKKKSLAQITLFLVMTSCLFFTSCEKEIEFRGEQTNPKLVVNSLVDPGQPISATISKSYFFLNNDLNTDAPNDLTASLYVNGNPIGAMIRQTDTLWNEWYEYDEEGNAVQSYRLVSVFSNAYRPQEGDIIKIMASANGFDDVEGETSPLPKRLTCSVIGSEISDIWITYEPDYYNENEEDSIMYASFNLELTLETTDPNPGQTDYFRLRFKEGSLYDDGINYLSYFAEYNDPVFGSLVAENDYLDLNDLAMAPEGVFTDVLFDGKSYRIKVPISVSIRKNNAANPDFFRITIALEHLSKEYYNYLNTCDQGNEFTQFLAEPIQTYTNVEGGYGIVAGRTVDTLWLALPLVE